MGTKMAQVSLDDVYTEVKKVNMRLESIEKALETFMDMVLPEEEIDEDEWNEIDEIESEIERGEYTSLEELKRKHGVK
jgi:predicted DNA-binding protein YlxM (UPF0122 family)